MLDFMNNGLLNLPWWACVAILLLFTHITILSVTIFLHRCQAHKALEMHPVLSHFFRFWLWLTTGMSTRAWVAIHRKHHAACETEEDPHSPMVLGIKKVLFEGAELYRKEAKNSATLQRFGAGTPNDWLEKNVYAGKFSNLGVVLMLLIDILAFGVLGLTVWAVQMLWIPLWAAGVINGVGHYWGYRNYEVPDASTNISPLGILIGGEELHNNHHTFPSSAKFSIKPWEFDLGWAYIKLFSWLGLAKVKRVAQKLHSKPTKVSVDLETVSAVVKHRFQVLARYSREVIKPVLLEEKRRASEANRALLGRVKKLMIRDSALIKTQEAETLAKVLQTNDTLAKVYQFRMKLQQIWQEKALNQAELLQALQDWCQQAEASSVEALRNFVNQLRAFVPAKAST
jgi:stearoyl-CoA desaturase (delta-9 desaturase)